MIGSRARDQERGNGTELARNYSLDRLVGETCSTNGLTAQLSPSGSNWTKYTKTYSYDLAANRLSKTTDGWKTSYTLGTGNRLASSTATATNTYFVSGTSSETIGTDDTWGTLYISNLTANTAVVPDVNGSSFSAEVPVLGDCTNTLVVAIRDEAGNMGYATNHLWVGDFTTESSEAQSFGYDSAGCLTNLNGVSLALDERYRLTKVDVIRPADSNLSTSVEYEYDVLGHRVSRTTCFQQATNVQHYVYNGNQIVADLAEDGSLLRTYIWGNGIDNLLCFTDHTTSNTYYAVKDHQNTVLALADEAGTLVESYEYSAYGEVLDVKDASGNSIENRQSSIGNRYTFQGREIDWTTGLIYFRARWYDPSSGRWISKDPIGISGGLNLYEFCGSNPVNFIDPGGLDLHKVGAGESDTSAFHMKLQLTYVDGNGNNAQYTISFFMDMTAKAYFGQLNPKYEQGEVDEDGCDGEKLETLELTPEQDQAVLEWMKGMD